MYSDSKTIVIAFDGTAASGKGTIAKLIAKELRYDYLDTGSMFRKVAYNCIKLNIPLNHNKEILIAINNIDFNKSILDEEIYSNIVGEIASYIAIKKEVREQLLKIQRGFAYNRKGIVLDGRDIGTIVFPDADFKFFFDASLEKRAKRRYNQLRKMRKSIIFSQVFKYLKIRDTRDKGRLIAPLKKAKDSFAIDTTNLKVNELLDIVLKKIKINLIK